MFLGTLDEKAWRNFLSELNHETKSETTLENFKEELWNTVVKFGELVLMGTGLDEKARKELLSKTVKLRETRQKTKDDECKDGTTLKKKTDDKIIKVKGEDKIKTSNMIKRIKILKARAGRGKSLKSRKSKRETEELSSPSVDAVSEKKLARWKTAAYKKSSEPRRLAKIVKKIW